MPAPQLKILYLTTIKEIHLNILLDICQRFGHETHLIGGHPAFQGRDDLIRHGPSLWTRLRRKVYDDDRFLHSINLTRRVVRKIKPDIIHALGVDFWGTVAVKAASGVPVMVSLLGGDYNHRSWWEDSRSDMIRETLTQCNLVHTNSGPALTRFLQEEYDLDAGKVLSMPWGIEYQKIVDILEQVDPAQTRQHYGIKDDEFVILAPRGMRDVFANILNLIPAVKRLTAEGIAVRALIRTHGTDKELQRQVQAQITTHGLEDRFISIKDFLPYEEIISLHAIADAMVSIAKNDQPAAVILETMRAGAVPVISDLDVYRDVFEPDKNVVYIDDSSTEDIAQKLIQVARMAAVDKAAMVQANTKIVAEGYDSHRNGEKLNAAWQKLAKIRQQYAVPDS